MFIGIYCYIVLLYHNMNKSLWVEKYRPLNVCNIIQHEDIKLLIQDRNNLCDMPHLLFYGPPGTGKTSTALAICRGIFRKPEIIKERVLELNASDERGIKVVREKIKTFAAQALNTYDDTPFFKFIILDEADVMTNDSQFALRRIIEQYSHITRFILICNYVSKIIPPLASRCSKYKFNQITLDNMKIIIKNILTNENISFNEEKLVDITKGIYNFSNGDLRKAITLLQRSVYISNINKIDLSSSVVYDVSGIVNQEDIKTLYNDIIKKYNDYDVIISSVKNILKNGYSSSDILNSLSVLILNSNIEDTKKSKILIKMSDICNILSSGSNDFIQLLTICSFINNSINY